MSKEIQSRVFVCDFETTVYEGQQDTEVWASACVELFSDHVNILHSIEETYTYFQALNCNIIAYYHNLKFDGSFWLSYFLVDLNLEQAIVKLDDTDLHYAWLEHKDMKKNTIKYSISDKGMWYTITVRMSNGKYLEIRDSLKLLPFSVRRIGESFGTKHKKLEMEYTGYRYAGCEITKEEQEYIANDVLVVKEALEIMYQEGHKKLTIGSCCLEEFIKSSAFLDKEDYYNRFPALTNYQLDSTIFKYDNADSWIRKSYKGGWCYLAKGKENQIKQGGTTADVNSLYPSMMHSESGNKYPYGEPTFWKGDYIPDEALHENMYFFVRIKTTFYLRNGYLPFIQIKDNILYDGTEALETSDVYNPSTNQYEPFSIDFEGKLHDTRLEITLTMTDYYLLLEHYEVVEFEILDGCYFRSSSGVFDAYIDKWAVIKKNSKGAKRELAKLFLNNLYGKLASSTDSSFKMAYVKEDKSLGFKYVAEHNKSAGYIAVGSAITSYARNFTIRAAQANYHGVYQRGFIYADTDSIHCDLKPEEIVGIKVHDKNFCCWKLESCWDTGIFTRQKTYIEHVTHEDLVPIEELKDNDGNPRKPYYNVKCAGMPQKCKDLFVLSMSDKELTEEDLEKYTKEEKDFLLDKQGNKIQRTLNDFKVGLKIPGKLMPKRIKGGILLVDSSYEMR